MEVHDPIIPNYQSFDIDEWWTFLAYQRRAVKEEWDMAISQLVQRTAEHSNVQPQTVTQMETSPPLQQPSAEQMYHTSNSMEREPQFSHKRVPSIDEIEPCIPRMLEVPIVPRDLSSC